MADEPLPAPPQAEEAQHRRLVIGLQPVREALRARPGNVLELWLDRRRTPKLEALQRYAQDRGVAQIRFVDRAELDRQGRGVSHQGALAWAQPLELLSLSELLEKQWSIAIALDAVQDPQNFGAVLRSAVGVAGAAVIWSQNASAPLTPATFRASAGAVEHALLCRVPSLRGALQTLQGEGVQILGLVPDATCYLHETSLSERLVLAIGSEHRGLSRGVRQLCEHLVRLKTSTRIASLNVSVAAGIALYHCQLSQTAPLSFRSGCDSKN